MNLILKSITISLFFLLSTGFTEDGEKNEIIFTPISHATFVIQTEGKTIFVDPVGNNEAYLNFSSPEIILITDTHGDHLDTDLVSKLMTEKTIVIVPKAVYEELNYGEILDNGKTETYSDIRIEAIPMYNLTEDRKDFHIKGRGNGYVITLKEKRIYISGDTEDIVEMRNLKDIDFAFICMNLPYTMTVEQAASAVLEMKPKTVYPYHYRGKGGLSDIEKFKELVGEDDEIEVVFLEWYK